jgi:glycosyltransferase involved in cell wall biosynthesis
LWGEFYLKNLVVKKKIDIFWGAAHSLPKNLPKNIKKVITIFDLLFATNPSTLTTLSLLKEKYTTPHSIKNADLIMVPSESTKKNIINFDKSAKKKIHVINLGNCFQNKNKLIIDKNHISNFLKPYLLFVGAISPRKNLRRFFLSYSKLSENIKNQYNIIIVGKIAWGEQGLPDFIKKIGMKERVFFFSSVNDAELFNFYKNAKLLIFPSVEEGFGLPIIEAQSFGVPVLTSNISSMPEVAKNDAIYINPYSEKNITEVLYKSLKDKKILKQLKIKTMKNYKNLSWKMTAVQIYNLFKNLHKNV